jgi:hypothetical protein
VNNVSVEVPDPPETRVMETGENDGVKPGDEIVADRATGPVKRFWLFRVIVADPDVPSRMEIVWGLADMVKSGAAPTFRVIELLWDKGPTAPVTVTE